MVDVVEQQPSPHARFLHRLHAVEGDVALEEHEERVEPLDAEGLRAHRERYGLEIMIAPTAECVRRYLEKYKQKVIVVRNNADRERMLELLTQHR